MFDHLSIGVTDLDRAMAFYEAVLAPLGIVRAALYDDPAATRSAGFGPQDADPAQTPPFWLEERKGAPIGCPPGTHLCFKAKDRAAVHAFHAAGLNAGGTDNGAPGPRPAYGPDYYAGFLLDPDGWRIEAVTFSAT
ncbi:VOC family protein [Xanthobacter sp. DSM 24535]|uniref:VOC family protein n=1 Tax=Roseixanthobacter psychrophilus TaxID=3119917 RepID=UPI0037261A20